MVSSISKQSLDLPRYHPAGSSPGHRFQTKKKKLNKSHHTLQEDKGASRLLIKAQY